MNLGIWLLGLLCGLSLTSWTGHLAGLHLGGVPLLSVCRTLGNISSHPFTQILTSLSPRALFLQKRGLPIPKYSHNALQDSGEGGLWVPGGAGQSLVGLLFSDRTVRQGLDTSRQGRVGAGRGGGGGEKKKEVGGAGRETML